MRVKFKSKHTHFVSHPCSTWLSPKEYGSIRREVELTIVLLEQMSNGGEGKLSPKFCSRGLEDFCYSETISTRSMATCLKPEVLLRRRLVIHGVLAEQESQQRQGRLLCGEDTNSSCPYDHEAIRKACMVRANRENTMKAIERGLSDAERAQKIRVEDWMRLQKKRRDKKPEGMGRK